MGTQEFVGTLLEQWVGLDEKLRPQKFDLGEPVRKILQPDNINVAVQLWLNCVAPWAVDLVGHDMFCDLPVASVKALSEGFLVQAYPSSKQIGNEEARDAEKQLENSFGKEKFFCKDSVDISALKHTDKQV